MKKQPKPAPIVLFTIAAICFYVSSAFYFFSNNRTMGVITLLIGSVNMLNAGLMQKQKESHRDEDKDE